MLITSLVLQQVKEVGAVTEEESKNFDKPNFSFHNIRPSNSCNLALQKIKIMQRMKVLQCSEINDIHFRCTILCTHNIVQNCR